MTGRQEREQGVLVLDEEQLLQRVQQHQGLEDVPVPRQTCGSGT